MGPEVEGRRQGDKEWVCPCLRDDEGIMIIVFSLIPQTNQHTIVYVDLPRMVLVYNCVHILEHVLNTKTRI